MRIPIFKWNGLPRLCFPSAVCFHVGYTSQIVPQEFEKAGVPYMHLAFGVSVRTLSSFLDYQVF